MSKFLILDYACNNETGYQFPQIQEMKKDYDYDAKDSIYELAKFTKSLPDFKPNLDYFVLHKKAKFTDLLSNALTSAGFIISKRFKEILAECHLPEHAFFPASIYHLGNIDDGYYWLQIVSDFTEYVDYPNSQFFLYKNYSQNVGDINIKSKIDYEAKRQEIKEKDYSISIWAKKILLTQNFDSHLDLFNISRFNSDCFVSKSLHQLILDHKITGVEIKANNILNN